MWITPGRLVIVSLMDGSAVRGRVRFGWRPRVLKLVEAEGLTQTGTAPIEGMFLIPARSILTVQVV
jgi:hypothetical protein